MPINADKYRCECCDFKCSKQSEYNRHLLTRKHGILTNTYKNTYNKKSNKTYTCHCMKEYKHRQSLYNHQQTCSYVSECEPIEKACSTSPDTDVATTMMKIMQTQNEMNKELVETNKKICEKLEKLSITNSVVNNNNNSINNNFNLNMFLNDTCKNAMNITDFMDSIKLSIADMDYLGKAGYIEAVSRVIIDGLNQLDVTERPIHCTDAKRNSLYLKNNDEWNKETSEMPNMKRVIKNVTNKNQRKIYEWMEQNPTHKSVHTPKHKEYMSIVGEAMGPTSCEEENNTFKSIIQNVSTATIIDKHM